MIPFLVFDTRRVKNDRHSATMGVMEMGSGTNSAEHPLGHLAIGS